MPKQGYCAAIFYNGDETIASVEILPTQEAKHLILASKVGVEKRNFKVYRLGALLAKCVRESAIGPTPHAPEAAVPPCQPCEHGVYGACHQCGTDVPPLR